MVYLTTFAVQFYGRGDVPEYQRLQDIISFAVGDMWPDLTIVLDAPVAVLQARAKKRHETERFDALDTATLERIRAGYLWEAHQRRFPVVHAVEDIQTVFTHVWQQIASVIHLSQDVTDELPVKEPTAVADLLAQSPAAKVLKSRAALPPAALPCYHTPPALPDDLQCDYCDGMEQLLHARSTLVNTLTTFLCKEDPATYPEVQARKKALKTLRPLLPTACVAEAVGTLLADSEKIILSDDAAKLLPHGFASTTDSVRLASAAPRNELDLLPNMVFAVVDLPMQELKTTLHTWPYAVKSEIFQTYLAAYPQGKALQAARYELDFLTELSVLADLPPALLDRVQLQSLTPRYGYATPPEVEAAGLSDDYDAIFDQSLTLQSMLQARGYPTESQYATLLGHKQRWSIALSVIECVPLLDALPPHTASALRTSLSDAHPLLFYTHR